LTLGKKWSSNLWKFICKELGGQFDQDSKRNISVRQNRIVTNVMAGVGQNRIHIYIEGDVRESKKDV
jgi:hypothetical protein